MTAKSEFKTANEPNIPEPKECRCGTGWDVCFLGDPEACSAKACMCGRCFECLIGGCQACWLGVPEVCSTYKRTGVECDA